MHLLTIDTGNTRTKAVLFNREGSLVASAVFSENRVQDLTDWLVQFRVDHVIRSVTGECAWELADLAIGGLNIDLSHETSLPIKILYTTAHTLGRDRIAGACGAAAMFPGKPCLIVDAGTCVTTDVVNSNGLFLGGNISPGLQMRLQAMHTFTANLPLEVPGWPPYPFGDSTQHALQNGAALGILMEIEGHFHRAQHAFGEVIVVMTGGDGPFLASQLKCPIFAVPELVAHGLFQILDFNVKQLL